MNLSLTRWLGRYLHWYVRAGSASQYTALVTFANSRVVVRTSTDGKPQSGVFAQTTSGSFNVSLGELSFPGSGTYAVTITDTANAGTSTWQGNLPFGVSSGSTVSPGPSAS